MSYKRFYKNTNPGDIDPVLRWGFSTPGGGALVCGRVYGAGFRAIQFRCTAETEWYRDRCRTSVYDPGCVKTQAATPASQYSNPEYANDES